MIKLLKILGYIWLIVASVLIVAGHVGVVVTADTLGVGIEKLLGLLSPFNFVNWVVIFASLLPGILLLRLASHLQNK